MEKKQNKKTKWSQVRVTQTTKEMLNERKVYRRETYDDIIFRIMVSYDDVTNVLSEKEKEQKEDE